MKKTKNERNKEETKGEDNKKSAFPGAGKIYRNIEESKKH